MTSVKDQILELGKQQLLKGGYSALNFGEIARELNITRANIHYHFSDKQALADLITQKYVDQKVDEMDVISAQFENNFFGLIDAMERFMKENFIRHEHEWCVCTQHMRLDSTPDHLRDMSYGFLDRQFDMFIRIANGTQKAGLIPESININELCLIAMEILMGKSQLFLFKSSFAAQGTITTSDWLRRLIT